MGTAEWKDGRGRHVVRNTEKSLQGRIEVDGNVEVFEGGRRKRVRQDGDKDPAARID